jgi:hypothetical protein
LAERLALPFYAYYTLSLQSEGKRHLTANGWETLYGRLIELAPRLACRGVDKELLLTYISDSSSNFTSPLPQIEVVAH